MTIFIDSSAFYALCDQTDSNHRSAIDFRSRLFSSREEMVSSNYVLNQTLERVSRRLGRNAARAFGEFSRKTGTIRFVRVDSTVEEDAWKIYNRFSGKSFSFADCTSFVIMNSLGIRRVFTFDRHFAEFGFEKLPETAGEKNG